MIIGVDFDGTVVEHRYPDIGRESPNALFYLRKLQEMGAKLILFTMRSGRELDEAVAYLAKGGVKLYGVNTNPTQSTWTSSPKAYCHVYVDDAGIGIPVKSPVTYGRPVVDWNIVGPELIGKMRIHASKAYYGHAIYTIRTSEGWTFSDLGRGIKDELFTESACAMIDAAIRTSNLPLDEDGGFVIEFGNNRPAYYSEVYEIRRNEDADWAIEGRVPYVTTGKLLVDEDPADPVTTVYLCPVLFRYFDFEPDRIWFKLHPCK